MKTGPTLIIGIVGIAVAAGGGYWAGTRQAAPGTATAGAEAPKEARKPLYYRNPMGLPDTSPVPKKDPMGMDYIPVFAGEDADSGSPAGLKFSTEKIQKLGVKTEAAQRQALDRTIRAAGRVEPDERRVYAISPKFEGYVERLHVNATGQPVGKGQALFEVYSPELVSAQREYAIAAQGVESLKTAGADSSLAGMRQLAESSLQRLKNWDISEAQVKALAESGTTKRTLTFRSPVAGIVTEKKALQGMRFMPGEALYQVADLSAVWVVADVFEQDIAKVKTGARAAVRIDAYPGKTFEGKVAYVYPTLNAATRTIPVRIELPNPGLLLKPAMFAQVEVQAPAGGETVTIPTSAVIDSGTRQIAIVALGEGRFEPREVKLGTRSEARVEVIDGIREGEAVVIAANFLIDAESNLKAAVGGFSGASNGAPAPARSVGHQAHGRIDEIDAKDGTLVVTHDPVASLGWPAMTMEFKLANAALAKEVRKNATVDFEFVERAAGEWVITALHPAAGPSPQHRH